MATITEDIIITADPGYVWDAIRDVGALHTRVAPGVVTATEMVADADPPARRVTFANGLTLYERIVTIDETHHRLVWSIADPTVVHHNGALHVVDDAEGTCVTWTADVLPDSLADSFRPLMREGLAAMKAHLETRG